MPKKKSIKLAARTFSRSAQQIEDFVSAVSQGSTAERISWIHEYALIRLYREFEQLILHSLIGAINNDTSAISQRTGVQFPKHLTDEVCEYLLVGEGYFDFRGRDGLIGKIKKYVPESHYLVTTVKDTKYKVALEQLCALRNLAAHDSVYAKSQAKRVVNQKRLASAGAWLKKQNRFQTIAKWLRLLAGEIEKSAPY